MVYYAVVKRPFSTKSASNNELSCVKLITLSFVEQQASTLLCISHAGNAMIYLEL